MNPTEQERPLGPEIMGQISGFEDVPLPINVELDRRILTLRQVLSLDVDSVLKMSRSAGENLDLLIGGALVGFGESSFQRPSPDSASPISTPKSK